MRMDEEKVSTMKVGRSSAITMCVPVRQVTWVEGRCSPPEDIVPKREGTRQREIR